MSSKVLGSALMVGGGLLLAALVTKLGNGETEPNFSEKATTEAIGGTVSTMALSDSDEERRIAEMQQQQRSEKFLADQKMAEEVADKAAKARQEAISAAKDSAEVFDKQLEVQARPNVAPAPQPAPQRAEVKEAPKPEPKKVQPVAQPKTETAKASKPDAKTDTVSQKGSHTIVRGDTLTKLAKQYGVSVESLAAFNGMGRDDMLALGRVIRVPTGNVSVSNAPTTKTQPDKKTESKTELAKVDKAEPRADRAIKVGDSHLVVSGDTLGHLARDYGVSVEAIARLNNMHKDDNLPAGKTIRIPANAVKASTTKSNAQSQTNQSRPSQSSQSTQTASQTVSQAKSQSVSKTTKSETTQKSSTRPAGKNSHTMQTGDTLGHLAKQYGVSVDEIAKANGIGRDDMIPAGKTLTIPKRSHN